MYILLFLLKNSMNPYIVRKTIHIRFSSKDPIYLFFGQKIMDIQNKPKNAMYNRMKYNEYPTWAQPITIFSHD